LVKELIVYDMAMDNAGGRAPMDLRKLSPEHAAMVDLAGAAAEVLFGYQGYSTSSRSDLADAVRHLAGTGLKPRHIWPRALRFVELYRHQIQHVARHLDQQGILTGQQVIDLMRHRPPPWQSSRW
jgi:hypothetical protein